ncbi:MAG: carbohydrate ABC transporter permease [Clostridia bacterium]|nr:carbohydrate ABC transporter permease [Clostridia bacterium]
MEDNVKEISEVKTSQSQAMFDIEKEHKKQKVQSIIKNVFVYTFLTLCAVFAFLPFFWMFISSIKSEVEYRDSTSSFFPEKAMWVNYVAVLKQSGNEKASFLQILVNTLIVGFSSTIIGLVVIIITAYALAKMNFKGKNLLFSIMLGTMMIPGEMYTITNYITVSANNLGWRNTYTVLIVPFLVSVYYIYLMRNNFMQIPNSLYQAAKVDGLSDMGYLVKVMIPLTAPTLISITLLKFIGTWNSYIWPRLVNIEQWQMITNWVTKGFTDKDGLIEQATGKHYTEALTTLKMAAVCIVSLPLFVLFIFCRKYIMHGVSKSGTKG